MVLNESTHIFGFLETIAMADEDCLFAWINHSIGHPFHHLFQSIFSSDNLSISDKTAKIIDMEERL
jgi:hypothetical protein